MGLFKSKAEKQMDEIIQSMAMNMANNYKDNAQDNLRELEALIAKYKSENTLKEKTLKRYEDIVFSYQGKLKGYTHKDQKPYWT